MQHVMREWEPLFLLKIHKPRSVVGGNLVWVCFFVCVRVRVSMSFIIRETALKTDLCVFVWLTHTPHVCTWCTWSFPTAVLNVVGVFLRASVCILVGLDEGVRKGYDEGCMSSFELLI